jgi:hypothetical protein
MTESNGNNETAIQAASSQQEQIVALNSEVEAAAARAAQARQNFQTICTQAAGALNLAPQTPQGQILQQALMAAFQWGGEGANASDHALQRRKEVRLLEQFVSSQEAEIKKQQEHRDSEVAESKKRTAILDRHATSTEKLGNNVHDLVELLKPMAIEHKKSTVSADA